MLSALLGLDAVEVTLMRSIEVAMGDRGVVDDAGPSLLLVDKLTCSVVVGTSPSLLVEVASVIAPTVDLTILFVVTLGVAVEKSVVCTSKERTKTISRGVS